MDEEYYCEFMNVRTFQKHTDLKGKYDKYSYAWHLSLTTHDYTKNFVKYFSKVEEEIRQMISHECLIESAPLSIFVFLTNKDDALAISLKY